MKTLQQYVVAQKPLFICLTELKNYGDPHAMRKIMTQFPHYALHSTCPTLQSADKATLSYNGVGLLVHESLKATRIPINDNQGRLVAVQCQVTKSGDPWVVVGYYGENKTSTQTEYLDKIQRLDNGGLQCNPKPSPGSVGNTIAANGTTATFCNPPCRFVPSSKPSG